MRYHGVSDPISGTIVLLVQLSQSETFCVICLFGREGRGPQPDKNVCRITVNCEFSREIQKNPFFSFEMTGSFS